VDEWYYDNKIEKRPKGKNKSVNWATEVNKLRIRCIRAPSTNNIMDRSYKQ